MQPVMIILAALLAVAIGVPLVLYVFVPACKAIAWVITRIFTFIFRTFADCMRLIGAAITLLVLVPLTVGNVIFGRWSASAHFGRAIQAEATNIGRCIYRIAIGHPARLLCLTPLTEGFERRIPQVMAAAPGPDKPSKRVGQFDGYTIVGSLAGGGSGGRLYVARPSPQKLAAFARNGAPDVDQVVIKAFSLGDGSSLPQIVRENRALDAAKRLGLILEHELTDDRFFYVMKYVPGETLNLVTQRLHAACGPAGLGRPELNEALEFTCDLLRTLCHYHAGGLWHKDVKPDNIIISGQPPQAHLVDFGLITPLRSSMTLTTHGTEYFRDPELVRMALKGVKVHEVDGAKFDVYAVGAVLYSMIENSFPAHGGLSQISKQCPEAVRWVVRRAMTDYDKRYDSAAAMLADVESVLRAGDVYAMKPVELPSVGAEPAEAGAPRAAAPPVQPPPIPPFPPQEPARAAAPPPRETVFAAAGTPQPPRWQTHDPAQRIQPDIRVTHWWSGRYKVVPGQAPARPDAPFFQQAAAGVRPAVAAARGSVLTAREQLARARQRAQEARRRVQSRMQGRRAHNYSSGINPGIAIAVGLFIAVSIGLTLLVNAANSFHRSIFVSSTANAPATPQPSPAPRAGGSRGQRVYTTRFETGVAPAAAKAHGDLLVVCEWSKFGSAEQRSIKAQLSRLAAAGFTLKGDTLPAPAAADLSQDNGERPAKPATPAAPEADTETLAELRAAVGTKVYMSSDAAAAVRTWMDRSRSADIVLWINADPTPEPGSTGPAPHAVWLVAAPGVDKSTTSQAQAALEGH